ncbi:N-acetyltransferase B complex non catalytic subunit-domain-containing protein [Podospora aff. communis PSN243]|uniref:N-acetyltransferase B complex non catalytic subunit-domain-containing protein n=1 Tax=Podospora aff. communis PSN243 TaxID=3040156 RepID=A0AAV9G9N7_9PEZI|nr:N-acetyltransferase B complex non catalytic subunit-domain-containing protein [Podospora aff. communis PSN243]
MKYGYGRPALKSSVDVQLQTAFSDGNWNSVVRLADKRAKSLKDPYYEAIKVSAESQLDGAADRGAVLNAIEELVKQKTVPDIDTIELYEWAAGDLIGEEIEYADTLGPLRVKWAKANPKSPLAMGCLQSCLEYWDLVSAQQISTALDKAHLNSGDRKFMFWSITLTFLLSISPQCSGPSRKVYSLLVLKQLERAAEITENTPKIEAKDRGLLTEEEVCLYYRVLLAHGNREDFVKRVRSGGLGALAMLEKGHKLLFWECLDALEPWGEWDLIFDLCRQALRLGLNGATAPFFVCDLQVWKRFIAAASKAADPRASLKEVQNVLKDFFAIETKTAQMYKKNLSLALLESTFHLSTLAQDSALEATGMTPRVVQIGLLLDDCFDKLSAFDDVKGYVSLLTFEEAKTLVDVILPKMFDSITEKAKQLNLRSLICKIRYLLVTCPQTLSRQPSLVDGESQPQPYRCRFCSHLTSLPCGHCLQEVTAEAAKTYKQISADQDLQGLIPRLDKDPRQDLALVIATSLLKLSGLKASPSSASGAPLRGVHPELLLQAILLLDTQLANTPADNGLRLLLVELCLLIGTTSYARQMWIPMDVKRTIQDALSPLFFDRISTLSPALFQGSRPLMEPLRSYYANSLRNDSPLKIWDAFSAGSYTSILDLSKYNSQLRTSCTLMMTLVEEARATRSFGGRIDFEIDNHPLARHITDDTLLLNKTDYGSFPNLEGPQGPQIQEFVRLGPELSNERAHVAFLAEQFSDLLAYRPPKDYKPARPHDAAIRDRNYALESLTRLNHSLGNFIHIPALPTLLTGPEMTYYNVVFLLTSALLTSLSTSRGDPAPKTLAQVTSSIRTALSSLKTSCFHSCPPHMPPTLFALTDMHTVAHLRETALAVKHGAAFVLSFHERELARDRSGKSALHRDVVSEMKALEAVATKALAETKSHLQKLKEMLGEGGWMDRILDWTFGREDDEAEREGEEYRAAVVDVVGGRDAAEEWAGKMLESWRDTVKGWLMVRWD